ncbi:MAG: glycosyltransferase [Saprospiraceae bacterium]|nr:glycosyltransferase [Saprospiraceae bacterium]
MKENKTLLTLLPGDCLGGAEKVLKLMVKEWTETQGNNAEVVFLKKSECGSWDDINEQTNQYFSTYTQERFTIWYSLKQIYKVSRQNNVELTLASNTVMVGWLGFLRKLGVLKTDYLVGRESTQLLDRFTGAKRLMALFFYTIGYSNLDLVICQTTYMMERFYVQLPQAKNWNVKVIPNPFLLPNQLPKEDKSYDQYGNYIVGAGRLIQLKGFDLLIQSLTHFEELNLVILGAGKEEENLKKLATKLGLAERLFLPGKVNNVYDYFKHAAVCVISSRVEGFPNTLLEMMSVNEQVVSTLCAGDIDKIDGVVTCNTDNVEEMVHAIKTALNQTPEMNQLNRMKFDAELESRKPSHFLKKIYEHLNKNDNK